MAKPNKFTSNARKVRKNKVTIPKFIRMKLKIKDGDEVKFKLVSKNEVTFWKVDW
jgi:AbrB family looped-hinge helix DNA binding protein